MNRSISKILSHRVVPAAALLALPALALAAEAADGQSRSLLSPPEQGVVTAITTLVVFLTLLFVLSKFAFAPIAAGLKKREDKIRQDIADAETARGKAESTLQDLTARLNAAEAGARAITAKAVVDAETITVALKTRAQHDTEELRERALKDIETAKSAAIAEVHEQAVLLSTAVAEKILRRSINAEDQRDLVRSSLEQLQNVSAN